MICIIMHHLSQIVFLVQEKNARLEKNVEISELSVSSLEDNGQLAVVFKKKEQVQHTFKIMYLTVVKVILQSEVVEVLVSVVSEPVNVVSVVTSAVNEGNLVSVA